MSTRFDSGSITFKALMIGIIVLIVFWVQDSQAGANDHGPNPKTGA